MLLNLKSDLDYERFNARVEKWRRDRPVVEITEKTARSLSQNRYLHLLIGVVAMETGVSLDYAKEHYFKRLVNRDIFCLEIDDRFVGKAEILRSSADLTKEEATMSIDRFKQWGREQGWYMPDANEESLLRMIEIEMGRMKRYL